MAERNDKDLLKLVTCGSVDDGKSTLIGHMLYDAKLIYTDQAQALELESKVGSADGDIDYSLLLDGLAAEREQGITIDVAYRYFSTERRNFIVADAPGHEEYTRNMAVGASFADLAVILVDVTKGLLTQTYRHARICSLMGIRHFVFAINKMDLVDYSKVAFDWLESEVRRLAAEFDTKSVQVIPVSAKTGANVTERSEEISWYQGPSLLEYLETVDVQDAPGEHGFNLPVQRVSRPNQDFRGYQGTIASGQIAVGDEVTVLPSGTTSQVTSILIGRDQQDEAGKGQAVTITLADDIDISRGCVMVHHSRARMLSFFTAKLLWMDDDDLLPGKSYLFKLGTQTVSGVVLNIKARIDVNTGERQAARRIRKNEIAECDISLSRKIVCESFADNRTLGSMILIDRVSNMTSGAGTIDQALDRSNSLTWHDMDITRDLRQDHMGQRACTIWFTGLSGSGKSTLANALEKKLFSEGKYTMLLDGDNVRLGLNKNLGFDDADRIENIRRISEVAKLMNDAGLIVLTSFISPFIRDRRSAREIIGTDHFFEIYVSTPLEICEGRDVKGLYARAREGKIANFTGITSPYEPPEAPDITINTDKVTVDDAVNRIVETLRARNILGDRE